MTLQATPPLPDPNTGRIPEYTQTLNQDDDPESPTYGQWTVMYDVSESPASSGIGIIDEEDPFTDVITELPSGPDEQMGWLDPSPEPEPEPDPYEQTQGGPGHGGGGGGDPSRGDPDPGGYVTGLDGNYYSTETGEQVDPESFTHKMLKAIQNYSLAMKVGSVINNTSEITKMSRAAQRAMYGYESVQAAYASMTSDQQKSYKEGLIASARMNKTSAEIAGITNPRSRKGLPPPGRVGPSEVEANPHGVTGGTDSNFGGAPPGTGTGAMGPAGGQSTGGNYGATGGPAGGQAQGTTGGANTGAGFGQAPGHGSGAQGPAGGAGNAPGHGSGGQGPAGGAGNAPGHGSGGQGPAGGAGRGGGQGSGPGGQGSGPGGRGDGPGGRCFVIGTPIQMQNNTTKPIEELKVGDNTKGGKVLMTMTGAPEIIYNYLGVEVSGSHWVLEDKQFIEVENSKHAVLTDKVEPVYTLITDNHRIFINDIEFADYLQVSDEVWEPHYQTVKENLNKELRGEA